MVLLRQPRARFHLVPPRRQDKIERFVNVVVGQQGRIIALAQPRVTQHGVGFFDAIQARVLNIEVRANSTTFQISRRLVLPFQSSIRRLNDTLRRFVTDAENLVVGAIFHTIYRCTCEAPLPALLIRAATSLCSKRAISPGMLYLKAAAAVPQSRDSASHCAGSSGAR